MIEGDCSNRCGSPPDIDRYLYIFRISFPQVMGTKDIEKVVVSIRYSALPNSMLNPVTQFGADISEA